MSFIELVKVNKTFHTKQGEVKALDEVNLSVEKGEIFGIVGYSGAGKSTLIRLINGLDTATGGKVLVRNEEIATLKKSELRKFRQNIGMIFQHFNLLWSRTVCENIELPMELTGVPKNERVRRSEELMALVGLKERANSYPAQLSGGQKQRVGIARALANRPDILLSDESTSALDPQTTDEVLDLLQKINRELGITILLITHEMHVIRKIANKVVVMEKGKIIEEGSVREVFQNPQTQTTKNFVTQELDPEIEQNREVLRTIQKESPNSQIATLIFNEGTSDAVISNTIKKFDIEISILSANLARTAMGVFGSLTILLSGTKENQQLALEFIRSKGISVEVRHHVS